MAITVRGTPAWVTNAAPTWPAGTREGDLAFLVSVVHYDSGYSSDYGSIYWANRPSAWIDESYGFSESVPTEELYSLELYRLTVPASTSGLLVAPVVGPSPSSVRKIYQMLVVFANAGGIYNTIRGTARVSTPPNGAAFITGLGLPTPFASMTALAVESVGNLRSFWKASTSGNYTNIGDAAETGSQLAVSFFPAAAPSKPTITTPAQSAQVGTGQNVPVTIQHNVGVPGGSAKAYRLRVRQNAGTWYYWNQSAGTLSSTTAVANTITGTSFTVTLPNAVITGATVEMIAETQESLDDQWSPVSDTRTFTRVSPPTVVVTGPGALSGDLSPTVTWVTTPGIGSQTDYRVVITDATTAVLHDSGTLTGTAATYTAPGTTAWVSGATVTAAVTVTQTGGAQATDTDTFSVSWTAPTAPTVAATVAAQGVTVVVTAAASRLVRVWRRSGTTDTLLGAWETGTDDVLTVVDVFGPTTAVTYRAQVWSDLDGVLLPSTVATSGSMTRTDRGCYIGSALDPAQTWRTADLESEADRTHIRPVGVVWPIGGTYSRTLSGPSRGKVGGFTQHVTHGVDAADMVALLESGETLLVRIPPESYGNAQSNAGQIIPLSVTSEVTESRQAQGPWARRILSWSWAEQAWPDPSSSVAPVTSPATLT